MRTTSSLESLNSVLKRTFPLHPNMFRFMERLKVFEFGKQLKMFDSMRKGPSENRRRLQDRLRDEKVRNILHQLNNTEDDFNIGDFFNMLANQDILPNSGEIYILVLENKQKFIIFFILCSIDASLPFRKLNLYFLFFSIHFQRYIEEKRGQI